MLILVLVLSSLICEDLFFGGWEGNSVPGGSISAMSHSARRKSKRSNSFGEHLGKLKDMLQPRRWSKGVEVTFIKTQLVSGLSSASQLGM